MTKQLPMVEIMTAVDKNGNPISNPEIDKLRLRLMTLFGVETPKEIEQLMKSPAGIEAVNMVVEEIELAQTFEKQRELDEQRAKIHPDLKSTGEKIIRIVEKQAKKIEEQKEIDDHRIEIKTEAKSIVEKFESEVKKIKKDDKEL